MSSPADRGKEAEGLVRKELEKLAVRANFDFERVYDARSSKGSMLAERTGDFQVWAEARSTALETWTEARSYVLEVKEVEHEFRLPKSNFGTAQRARMVKRSWTGCRCWVLVYFKPLKLWRIMPISYFGSEKTGSWDMSDTPLQSLKDIMGELYG